MADGPEDRGDGRGRERRGDDGRDGGRRPLRASHATERAVGMDYYVSDADGIGGRLRRSPEAFRVRELERIDPEPIDADPGAYPHVVLRATLRDWDTNGFASALSDRLGISRERVHWAGTKDKRAVTTQLFSVSKVDPAALQRLGGANEETDTDTADESDGPPPLTGVDLEVLGRLGRSIEFGDLAGNEFEIGVADATHTEQLAPITASLAAFGRDDAPADVDLEPEALDADEPVEVAVPNYFGQQRFGSRRPISHEVGLAIVRRDWAEAVRTYVAAPYESEPETTREARRAAGDCMADGDFAGAIDALPQRLDYERAMVHALDEAANASSGEAETAAGDPARPDYRAALDALPWNLQRLFVHAAQSYAFNRVLSERLERGLPFARPVEGDVVCFADADAPDGLALPDTDRLQRVTADRVDTVARHCERGRAFVTAPLVGTETDLGDGEPGEIERAVLDELELQPDAFDLPEPFDSTGTRRAILVRTSLRVDGDEEPTFEFALPKGSYATVMLREYLKADPVDLG